MDPFAYSLAVPVYPFKAEIPSRTKNSHRRKSLLRFPSVLETHGVTPNQRFLYRTSGKQHTGRLLIRPGRYHHRRLGGGGFEVCGSGWKGVEEGRKIEMTKVWMEIGMKEVEKPGSFRGCEVLLWLRDE